MARLNAIKRSYIKDISNTVVLRDRGNDLMEKSKKIKIVCFIWLLTILTVTIIRIVFYTNGFIHFNSVLRVMTLDFIEGSWAVYYLDIGSSLITFGSLIIIIIVLSVYSFFSVSLLYNYKAVYVLIVIFFLDVWIHGVSIMNYNPYFSPNPFTYFTWEGFIGFIFDVLIICLLLFYRHVAKNEVIR